MKNKKLKNSFTKFEKDILGKLLQGEDVVLAVLRKQYKQASVKSREETGYGFFLKFSLPLDIIPLTEQFQNVKPDFCFGDVGAKIKGIQHGAGFLLWIKNGKLLMLEGYSYDETWPDRIEEYQLSYYSNPRDIEQLRKQWQLSPNE